VLYIIVLEVVSSAKMKLSKGHPIQEILENGLFWDGYGAPTSCSVFVNEPCDIIIDTNYLCLHVQDHNDYPDEEPSELYLAELELAKLLDEFIPQWKEFTYLGLPSW
jgi:hypothetical protein